jgi:arabinan endo-1,5-alpha-L-arabinosidase
MIDPCFFADPKTNRHYLYYGSAHEPIRAVELAEDGFTFLGPPVEVLWPRDGVRFETLREGAFMTYHSHYDRYYLWVSGDNTWAENGYAVSVFWSNNALTGFEPIPERHIVLGPNKHWDSPGQTCVFRDAASEEWLVYHAVDVADRYITGTDRFLRKMCLDKVLYTADGWPYIADYSPSVLTQPGPRVNLPA